MKIPYDASKVEVRHQVHQDYTRVNTIDSHGETIIDLHQDSCQVTRLSQKGVIVSVVLYDGGRMESVYPRKEVNDDLLSLLIQKLEGKATSDIVS